MTNTAQRFWIGFTLVCAVITTWWLSTDLATVAWNGQIYRYQNSNGLILWRDFYNFWNYGVEAWGEMPGRFYDRNLYQAHILAAAGEPAISQLWSYPPTLMLIAAPFGLLPYHVAFVCWQALSVLLFFAAIRPYLTSYWALALAFISPAALVHFHSGQNAFFLGAMMILGLRLAESRSMLAGLCLGVLTVKPQLGLMVPFLLLYSQHYRAFAWACGATIMFTGLSILVFGLSPWQQYIAVALTQQLTVLANNDPVAHYFMPSLYISLQLSGFHNGLAMVAQMALAGAIAVSIPWLFQKQKNNEMRIGYGLLATIAATPYLMSYDLIILIVPVLVAIRRFDLNRMEHGMLALLLMTPLVTYNMGGNNWPGGCLPLLVGTLWFVWKASQQNVLITHQSQLKTSAELA